MTICGDTPQMVFSPAATRSIKPSPRRLEGIVFPDGNGLIAFGSYIPSRAE